MIKFSDRLAEAIRHSGKSKGALASYLGVPQSSVSRWLVDTEPRADRIAEIAKFLSVDVKWLLYGADQENASSLREDSPPYHFTPKPPLREPGEPSLTERLAEMEKNSAAMRESMEAMRKALDELTDLFTGRRSGQ